MSVCRPDFQLGVAAGPELQQAVVAAIVQLEPRHDLSVAAIETLGESQDGRKGADRASKPARQLAVAFVRLLRRGAAVIARDQPDHLDFVGLEASKVAVLDQVIRVLVMAGVADVDSHVVKQRRVLEPLPLPIGQVVHGSGLIEKAYRQFRDLCRVLGPVVTAISELDDASSTDIRVALDLGDLPAVAPDVVEDEPLPQRQIAQRQLGRAKRSHDRVEQHRTRHHQVCPARIESRNLQALLQVQIHDRLAQPVELFGRDPQVSDIVRDAAALLGRRDGPEAQNRPGGSDDAIEPGGDDLMNVILDLGGDVPDELPFVLPIDRIRSYESLGESDHAELEALRELDLGAGAQRDLDAPATDIDRHGRRSGDIDAVHRCQMDEARLFGARDDLRADARLTFDRCEKFAAVLGLSRRAGGRGHDLIDLMRLGQPPKLGQCLQCRRHRLLSQGPPTQATGTEPDHFLLSVDHFERQVRPHIHDDHVDRVRPDVDGCYPHESIRLNWEDRIVCAGVGRLTIMGSREPLKDPAGPGLTSAILP